MEKIDKISEYGNIIFAVVLYTATCIGFGLHLGDKYAKHYQAKRLMTYDWKDNRSFERHDINWIIYGVNE